jgi:ubiquinone/menaquinone biosynthesis C-methylase UbiE
MNALNDERRRSHWANYVNDSKSRSSSALTTAENFIKWAPISKGSRILDMGCGHGRVAELVIEKVPGLELVGVDMTRHLLDNFAVKPGTNDSKITLICGDITNLPLGDSEFDAVISSRVFQYLSDPMAGVREAVRVLKPGGSLVIAIPNKLNVIKFLTYKPKLYSPFQVRDWFTACGLQNVHCSSMCFFPSTVNWRKLALIFEIAEKIPVLKYLGGNVLVKGTKKK